MSETRTAIIETMIELIERQGYHATGLNRIVAASGAPKGSLYYYFPEGKDQITEEAIAFAGQLSAERIRQHLVPTPDPAEAVRTFVHTIAYHLENTHYCTGGPLQTVALETATTNERLNAACRRAYEGLIAAFQEVLSGADYPAPQAAALAVMLVASIEGGILISRTMHQADYLRQVGQGLYQLLRAAPPTA